MTAVQIAGCSAAGKSTVAAVLAGRGPRAIDADADPLLARMTDRAGAVVPDTPAAPALDWLARHDWGQIGDTRASLIRKLPVPQASLRAAGATAVDARQSPAQVADAILARLRPGLPTAG